MRRFLLVLAWAMLSLSKPVYAEDATVGPPVPLMLVPNFHDAAMGWLVSYAQERNFGLYNYLAHLDRVAADPNYKFSFSEIPHLITMQEFEPARFEEFKQRVAEGRVELANAFVLEPTVSLSGGEALVQQGVAGLQWYDQTLGRRPRYAWMIDLCGWHEQMAQISAGLGLEAFVYCRYNPTGPEPQSQPQLTNWDDVKCGKAIHWIASPDGSRVLAVSPGLYCDVEFQPLFRSERRLTDDEIRPLIAAAEANRQRFPAGWPLLIFGGEWDYSRPFLYRNYPAELIPEWNRLAPSLPLRIATLGEYLAAIQPFVRAGEPELPVAVTSRKYGWAAFWVNVPRIKQRYRRTEHRLQAAEALATIASTTARAAYPAQELADSWFLMAMNMDRNVLWGAGVDESFADAKSWDAEDRFAYVDVQADAACRAAVAALGRPAADAMVLFNPLSWVRRDPVELHLPPGKSLADAACQAGEDGYAFTVLPAMEPLATTSARLVAGEPATATASVLPPVIANRFYEARIDPATGALASLKLKSSGREMLGGPANTVHAEGKSDVHNLPEKSLRTPVANSNQFPPSITVTEGPVATVVQIRSGFVGEAKLCRTIRFYREAARIDFDTMIEDAPAGTILSVEFPLAEPIREVRRGIPYGFSTARGPGGTASLPGIATGIAPAIRFSHYALAGGGGLAILDRGIPGRELVDKTAILLLHNCCDAYALSWQIHDELFSRPSQWLSGQGKHRFQYAVFAHEEDWPNAAIAQRAWEYNCPLVTIPGTDATPQPSAVATSANLLLESLRRVGDEIELRMAECLGMPGSGSVTVNLPHDGAWRTDLLGQRRVPLAAGPEYKLEVRPQEIVTLRLRAAGSVPPLVALTSFEKLIPPEKRAYMRATKNPKLVGHPPEPATR